MRYAIVNWVENFECAQSRRIVSGTPLKWVPMPTKHDSPSYRRLIAHADGAALFGAWCAFVQLAAKSSERGVVAMEPDDMSLATGLPETVFAHMLEACMSPKINWIERCDGQAQSTAVGVPSTTVDDAQRMSATLQDRTGHNKTGQEKEKSAPPARTDQGPEAFDLKTIPGILAAFQDINPAWGRGHRAEMAIANRLRGQPDPEILAVTIGKFLEILATEHAAPDAPFPLSRLTTWIGNSDKDAPQDGTEDQDCEEPAKPQTTCLDDPLCRDGLEKCFGSTGAVLYYCPRCDKEFPQPQNTTGAEA